MEEALDLSSNRLLNNNKSSPRHAKPRLVEGLLYALKNATSTALKVHTQQQNLERHWSVGCADSKVSTLPYFGVMNRSTVYSGT